MQRHFMRNDLKYIHITLLTITRANYWSIHVIYNEYNSDDENISSIIMIILRGIDDEWKEYILYCRKRKYELLKSNCKLFESSKCRKQAEIPMQYCREALGHCMYKCWVIVNGSRRNKLQWNLNQNASYIFQSRQYIGKRRLKHPFLSGLYVIYWQLAIKNIHVYHIWYTCK